MGEPINVRDLGVMPYRAAWKLQEEAHERVLAGGAETIFIVEHPAVVTLGRRAESIINLVTNPIDLAREGIEVVHSDRGGDITFHGPGQIVAYPIIHLKNHGFFVGGYVHQLEKIVIATLGELGIEGRADPEAIGVWVPPSSQGKPSPQPSPGVPGEGDGRQNQLAKICAIGVRIRRGISLHGLALNVSTDLRGFSHIVPCGLTGRKVTSIAAILADSAPSIARIKEILVRNLLAGFSGN
jgi:lipoyl(octanoyl) transferase